MAETGGPRVEARALGDARDPAAVQADQEAFVILVLNATRRIVQLIPLFRGGVSSAPVDPKVVLRAVLVAGGTGFVAAHHHAPRTATLRHACPWRPRPLGCEVWTL